MPLTTFRNDAVARSTANAHNVTKPNPPLVSHLLFCQNRNLYSNEIIEKLSYTATRERDEDHEGPFRSLPHGPTP